MTTVFIPSKGVKLKNRIMFIQKEIDKIFKENVFIPSGVEE